MAWRCTRPAYASPLLRESPVPPWGRLPFLPQRWLSDLSPPTPAPPAPPAPTTLASVPSFKGKPSPLVAFCLACPASPFPAYNPCPPYTCARPATRLNPRTGPGRAQPLRSKLPILPLPICPALPRPSLACRRATSAPGSSPTPVTPRATRTWPSGFRPSSLRTTCASWCVGRRARAEGWAPRCEASQPPCTLACKVFFCPGSPCARLRAGGWTLLSAGA